MKKTITRYVGKAVAVIKQDGLVVGMKKILEAAYFILMPVKPGDVLFISSGVVGDSMRYRVRNVAEELEMKGFKCGITIQESPLLAVYASHFKIFVFHRVNLTPNISKFIKKIKEQGKEIIFETDDLLFDPELLKEQDFFKNINELEKKFYENGVGGEILSDSYVKVATTTTNFLAEKLREHGKKVFLVPNRLSKKDLEVAKGILDTRRELRSTFRIGYFSGVMSHNRDFATINEALMYIMEKYPMVELHLVGPLNITNELNKYRDRIVKLPFAPREQHFANMANVDINIAPLEIGNPFCESKSELKFFEAGILRIPTVAAATEPFLSAIVDGEDGFVANGTAQWIEKLESLINDRRLRESMSERAREKALAKYTTENAKNDEYYAFLRNAVNKVKSS